MPAASLGKVIIAKVSVELLDVGNLPDDKDSARLFTLRCLGEARQAAPLPREGSEGGRVRAGEIFDFCAYFDDSWTVDRLRQLLASERLRIDLLSVPCGDPKAWTRSDFGVRPIANYRVCPWPWLQTGAFCSRCETEKISWPVSRRSLSATWLHISLKASIEVEVPLGCLHLPRSGDILEVPQQCEATQQCSLSLRFQP